MAVGDRTYSVRRAELEQVLHACRSEHGPGALVTGETGVGKTALVREAAADWADDGGQVIWIGATESSRRFTFGAFVGVAARLDPADFDGSARLILQSVSGSEGVLLVVDDAHLLDPASATLVHRLSLLPAEVRLLVTVCAGQPAPDAVGHLAKDRLLEVVDVAPFSRAVTGTVLSGLLAGHVEHPTCDRLFELSGGNPFVLHELVAAGKSSGVLRQRSGAWSWRGEVPADPRLSALVGRRLREATPEVRRTLELLCLAEPLALEQLSEAVGSEAVATAEDAGLLVVERLGSQTEVRCAHVLYSRLVRAGLGTVRTIEALRLLDKVLDKFPPRGPADRLKRAVIRLESGDPHADDAEVFTEASRLARPHYALAERFARSGLEAGGGFTALDYLVDALLWQGKTDEAKAVTEAVTLDLSVEQREYFSLRWARMLWWMTGERPDATVGADGDAARLSPVARLGSIARQAAMAATAGRGLSITPDALAVLADADADDEARCWAAGAAMIGLGGHGRLGDALRLSDDAFECARRIADFNYRLLLSTLVVWLCRLAGYLGRAQREIDELRAALGSAGDPNAGLVALSEAEIVLAAGRVRDAIPLLRDAALRLDEVDFGGLSASAHFRLADALGRTGDPAGAKVELARGAELESRTIEMFRPEQLLTKAWAHLGTGDPKIARSLLSEAEAMAAGQGQHLVELHVLHAGVRLGDRGAARRLARVAGVVEAPMAALAHAHARAFLDRRVDGLVDAGGGFADRGMPVEAADAVAQAARIAARSDPLGSRRLANRATSMAAAAGGFDSPALRAVAAELPLTPRQRQIADLAASGLSNRAIADRMGIGVRTVESHLDAAYRRLGVTSRNQLSGLLSGSPTSS